MDMMRSTLASLTPKIARLQLLLFAPQMTLEISGFYNWTCQWLLWLAGHSVATAVEPATTLPRAAADADQSEAARPSPSFLVL